jgi:hypothetical protein
MVFKKILVHVYTDSYPFGFGEFVRGTLFLIQYANKNNMIVRFNIANHSMSEYLIVDAYDITGVQPKIYTDLTTLTNDLHEFKSTTVPLLAISTNIGIRANEIDPETAIEFNKRIRFTEYIYEAVTRRLTSDLMNMYRLPDITDDYVVINMYLLDTHLDRTDIQSLSSQIRTCIDLSKTNIVISNNEYIRNTLNEYLGGYRVLLSEPSEIVSSLENSIINFIIVSKSKKIYTFSEYSSNQKNASCTICEARKLLIPRSSTEEPPGETPIKLPDISISPEENATLELTYRDLNVIDAIVPDEQSFNYADIAVRPDYIPSMPSAVSVQNLKLSRSSQVASQLGPTLSRGPESYPPSVQGHRRGGR